MGERGVEFVLRISKYKLHICGKIFRLNANAFNILVNIMIERGLLTHDFHISIPEQIAVTLFILARGASYHEILEQLKYPLLDISECHNKVLDALVKLSADVIRPNQSQHEVQPQLLIKHDKKRY